MNAQPELTYDFFVKDLEDRIVNYEKKLANTREALLTIKTHPEIVPTLARMIRPGYEDY